MQPLIQTYTTSTHQHPRRPTPRGPKRPPSIEAFTSGTLFSPRLFQGAGIPRPDTFRGPGARTARRTLRNFTRIFPQSEASSSLGATTVMAWPCSLASSKHTTLQPYHRGHNLHHPPFLVSATACPARIIPQPTKPEPRRPPCRGPRSTRSSARPPLSPVRTRGLQDKTGSSTGAIRNQRPGAHLSRLDGAIDSPC